MYIISASAVPIHSTFKSISSINIGLPAFLSMQFHLSLSPSKKQLYEPIFRLQFQRKKSIVTCRF